MSNPVLLRRTVALGLPLALGACALRLETRDSPPDALLLVYRPVLRFSAPIRPDVEIFFARCRTDPDDAQAARWMRYALAPAERVLSEKFFVPVRLAPEILPDDGRVRLEFRQDAPLVARAGTPAFRQFGPLIADAAPVEIRWTVVAMATLSLASDDSVRYDTAIELLLEHRADGASRFANAAGRNRPEAVETLSAEVLAALESAYATHFRRA